MKKVTYILLFVISIIIMSCKNERNSNDRDQAILILENYDHEVVVSDISIPWGFTFLPDQSLLITEKSGDLIHFKNGNKTIISNLPEIKVQGQGGLMDIALHPDYENNGWLYITYASDKGEGNGANTALMRCKLENNALVDKKVLYKASPNSKRGQHFGSRIEFDNEGYLYFSIGDRGNRDVNPQNIERDCGKVYRINTDGSIPADNPFVRDNNAKKAIFSYGHRNIQGMARHPETGEIWTHEHGPKGGDEINIVEAGKNYGWPVISYGVNYSGSKFTEKTAQEGMEQPLHHWTPSIAPSGMAFVTSSVYPELKGKLLVGSLKFQYLNVCTLQGNKVIKEERLLDGLGRLRSIEEGPDGYIYAGVENVGIVKLIPKN